MKNRPEAVVQNMTPSEIRMLVLADHQEFRTSIDFLRKWMEELAAGKQNSRSEFVVFREQMFSLLDQVTAHMTLEERYLVPILREDYAWGENRVRDLSVHHHHLWREMVRLRTVLSESIESIDLASVENEMGRFVAALEVDMEDEEATLLRSDVLNDEVVLVEIGG